jgi:tetratricopeptide (TPR) repeat protein
MGEREPGEVAASDCSNVRYCDFGLCDGGVMRGLVLGAAILWAVTASASANEYALSRARTLYGQMQQEGQCEVALPAAREFWRSADFTTLSEQARAEFLSEIVQCAWELRDQRAAVEAARAAGQLGAPWTDFLLTYIGISFEDDQLTVDSFMALADNNPRAFAELPSRIAWGAIRAAKKLDEDGAAALRVHDVLTRANYMPPETSNDDYFRMDHAQLLLRAGSYERASARLETITEPRLVMMMRVDRTFDVIRTEAFQNRLDLVVAAEADLERARRAMTRDPAKLALVLETGQALRALGRFEEARALLDRHIKRAQSADGATVYSDIAEQLNWVLNELAYVYYDLDRAADARETFSLSIAVGESGEWSVSQVINFASMLESEGRAGDALEVLRTTGQASPYGDMWVASVRVCAADQTGDRRTRDEALAFVREHEADNRAAAARALLCVNDIDAAAGAYIRRLADEEARGDALLALQEYPERSDAVFPRDNLLRQRLEQVRDRADVRAAIDAVGRVEQVPLRGVYWGDF